MRVVTVKITKSEPFCWYAGMEGQKFEVYDDRRDYILKYDYDAGGHVMWRHIAFHHCVEVDQLESDE